MLVLSRCGGVIALTLLVGCMTAGAPGDDDDTDNGTGQARAAAATPAVYRINAGGPAYTDPTGAVWQADAFFNTGTTLQVAASTVIGNTTMAPLYRDQRWDAAGTPELRYSLPVTN